MLAMLRIIQVLTLSSLVRSSFAVTAYLFDVRDCPSALYVSASCSNIAENDCCTDPSGYYISSAILVDIGDNLSVLQIDTNGDGKCNPGLSGVGQVCLQTSQNNILGIAWQSPSSDVATHVAVRATCNSQVADIRYVALPGEQRKPYSSNVTKLFDQAEVVNWSTHSFKTDKLDVVQELIAQHGDGLDEAQAAAIFK